MRRHSVIARLGPAEVAGVNIRDSSTVQTEIRFIDGERKLAYGLGQTMDQLVKRGVYPSETAIDLAIAAATITAADTRISRESESQDSWTREIDLYLPVHDPDRWDANAALIGRTLRFLTGDIWRLFFRARHAAYQTVAEKPKELLGAPFTSVCLFSGGLDSFVGAIDLLAEGAKPIFVSHYWDAGTGSQKLCAQRIGAKYGDMQPRHVRAHIGFRNELVPGAGNETTTRGRSFLFLALAALAASGLNSPTLYVPENGLISLNVPLDLLRLGAWSTRTTHPFYLARWQELLDALGIAAIIRNPYRFRTKGEMISGCADAALVKKFAAETISCSSVAKGRYKKQSRGHCGYCLPCLIRRAAMQAALGSDATKYSLAIPPAHPLNGRRAESEHIRSFQLMARRLARQPGIENILVHKPGPLSDYPVSDITEYADVFRRGIQEVDELIKNIIVRA